MRGITVVLYVSNQSAGINTCETYRDTMSWKPAISLAAELHHNFAKTLKFYELSPDNGNTIWYLLR